MAYRKSGTEQIAIPTPENLERHEAARLEGVRAALESGALTMREVQERLVEVVLCRSASYPAEVQEDLRRTLMSIVELDPYFQLVRDTADAAEVDR